MKPSDKIKQQSRDLCLQQAVEKFQSAAQHLRYVMEPYQDKMETEEGKVGMAMVSTIAIAVLKGAESPAALATAIEVAADKSGIPKDAFEAYARFVTAMINASEIRHQNNSPC